MILRKLFYLIKSSVIYAYFRHKYRRVDYFQYKKLADKRFVAPSGLSAAFVYGNYKAVAKLKGSKFNFLREYIEHGVFFDSNPANVKLLGYPDRPLIKRIYTHGYERKRVIEEFLKNNNLNRQVIAVGPFIKGVDHFKTEEELALIKKKYGKILLVYPLHSVEGAVARYDLDDLLCKIDEIRNTFDSVFVCLYWKDILDSPEYITKYEDHGCVVVTNGHRSDYMFLNRQKDLIYLSDMVMTNGIGTYIGYSICMNRPVYFYDQTARYERLIQTPAGRDNTQEIEKCKQLFKDFSFEITDEQIRFIEKHWGTWSEIRRS
ncbi:MAG: hypothetical protein LBQ31_11235 [Bacteroidales bacterium]|jgi:hypothetical protein|nr:hypothetical protein [Bacteroidales bacterium]